MTPLAVGTLLTLLTVALPRAAVAQAPPVCIPSAGGGILTGLAQQFSTTTASWGANALLYAQHLFMLLVAIELAWSAITYVLQKDSLPDFIAALSLKLLAVGFFYMLIQPAYGPVWIGDIVTSFSQAGSAISGHPQFGPGDPSSIFSCGTQIGNAIVQSVSQNDVHFGLGGIVPAIVAVVAALVSSFGVVIAFAVIAGQLLVTMIEADLVIGGGLIMLGFMGSRWTLVLGENYIGYAFGVGIKLFMLELIVGLGYALGRQWAGLFGHGLAPPETYIEVVGAAVIFMFVAWQVPNTAAALMKGSPGATLGTFLNTIGTTAVGTMTAVGGALSVGRAAVDQLAPIAKAAMWSAPKPDVTTGPARNGVASGVNARAGVNKFGNGGSGDVARATSKQSASTNTEQSSGDSAARASSASGESTGSGNNTGDRPGDASPVDDARASGNASQANEASSKAPSDPAAAPSKSADADRPKGPTGPARRASPASFGLPPAPDDTAEGNIHIRFKHPE